MKEQIQHLIPILHNLEGSWIYAEPILHAIESDDIPDDKIGALIALLSHSLDELVRRQYEGKDQFLKEILHESHNNEQLQYYRELKEEERILSSMI